MRKIKVGDTVRVVAGKDSGKEGKVIRVINTENKRNIPVTKVLIEGVNKVKKAQKANPSLNMLGGIIEFEKPIDISNVMYLEGGVPTRIGFIVEDKTGKKYRISKRTGKKID